MLLDARFNLILILGMPFKFFDFVFLIFVEKDRLIFEGLVQKEIFVVEGQMELYGSALLRVEDDGFSCVVVGEVQGF